MPDDRLVAGQRSKLLGYLPLKGRKPPETHHSQDQSGEGDFAANATVPGRQSVLTLSANSRHPVETCERQVKLESDIEVPGLDRVQNSYEPEKCPFA
jgi:hypothetical protein